jgi:hypothetical protein
MRTKLLRERQRRDVEWNEPTLTSGNPEARGGPHRRPARLCAISASKRGEEAKLELEACKRYWCRAIYSTRGTRRAELGVEQALASVGVRTT